MGWAAVVVLALLAAADTGANSPGEGGDRLLRLTTTAPVVTTEVRAEEPTRLRVRVIEIENPTGTAFGVTATIVGEGTGQRREIGRFAVFPPDQTGDYILPVGRDIQDLLREGSDTAEFALVRETRETADLTVVLEPVWE
jgi:hypothetical protein